MTSRERPELSVVVPTLDEARHLPRLLRDLQAMDPDPEVVVVDGGSRDGTPELARRAGARVVPARPSRGGQLRAGARVARGRWLLFLHADSRLTPEAARAAAAFLARADEGRAAYFPFAVDGQAWWWRALELGQRLRERLAGLVYGDQGLLVSRTLYEAVDGHPDWPLMEDVEVVRRIRRAGRLERLEVPLPTSPRRYRREGPLRGWLRNAVLVSLFRLGVPPRRLVAWYAPEPPAPPPARTRPKAPGSSRRTLLVFAKAPRPGTVKTRLAADVGDAEATRIYRALGSGVVDAVRTGPWTTVVCYAPADARPEMRRWLGDPHLVFRPQAGGDLGRRMERAVEDAFAEGADAVCVVGADTPCIDGGLVDRAFHALEDHDVVLGPAKDGGYWLVGVDRPRPELFRDVPWSTPRVLEVTRARVRAAGLREQLLPVLADVDRLDDVPPELLEA